MTEPNDDVAVANWLIRQAAPLYLARVGMPVWSGWLAASAPVTAQSLSTGTVLRGNSGLLEVISSDLQHLKAAEHNTKSDAIRRRHHCSMDSMPRELLGAIIQAQGVFLPSKTGRRVRSIVEASAALLLMRADYEWTAEVNNTAAEALAFWPVHLDPPTPYLRSSCAKR